MAGVKGRSGGARPNSGGARKGAGRPQSRNAPALVADLPATNDPLEWLLALVAADHAPLRVRVRAAVVLLPYIPP